MNAALIGDRLQAELKTDWDLLQNMSDSEIHVNISVDPEVQATDDDFWKNAKVVMPRRKETVTIRLDADMLAWFRQEKGYQTKINAILRSYMASHTSP